MKSRKQNYITFSSEGRMVADEELEKQEPTPQDAHPMETPDVAYRLSRVAQEAAGGQVAPNAVDAADGSAYTGIGLDDGVAAPEFPADHRPRVLVMARGKDAKRLIQEAQDAGFARMGAAYQGASLRCEPAGC